MHNCSSSSFQYDFFLLHQTHVKSIAVLMNSITELYNRPVTETLIDIHAKNIQSYDKSVSKCNSAEKLVFSINDTIFVCLCLSIYTLSGRLDVKSWSSSQFFSLFQTNLRAMHTSSDSIDSNQSTEHKVYA